MMIGQLSKRTKLSVRTLRFYADSGLLPVARRTPAGYRDFDDEAVARARLVRSLRDLGVGLDDVMRILNAEASLREVAIEHARALDAQISVLRFQQAALRIFIQTNEPKEFELMSDLATLSADERRRIVDDYLDAVFGDDPHSVAEKLRMGTPDLPDDPTTDQVAAWVELVHLIRDPDFIQSSRRMAQRALAEGPESDVAQFEVGKAVGRLAGPAFRTDVDPSSPEALDIVHQIEAVSSAPSDDRANVADRIEAFTDRRVGRYWTLVGVINGWAPSEAPEDIIDAWEWYARALRAHA